MKARRPPSWDAKGLVEKAWKRLPPPATRDQLAALLRIKPTNLTKMNTGHLPMTIEYAQRIADVVPGLTVADLGAPSSIVAQADPTVLDRLEELAAKLADSIAHQVKTDRDLRAIRRRLAVLEAGNEPGAGAPRGSRP